MPSTWHGGSHIIRYTRVVLIPSVFLAVIVICILCLVILPGVGISIVLTLIAAPLIAIAIVSSRSLPGICLGIVSVSPSILLRLLGEVALILICVVLCTPLVLRRIRVVPGVWILLSIVPFIRILWA